MKIDFKYDVEKDLENYKNNFLEHKYPNYGREKLNLRSLVADINASDFDNFEGDKADYIRDCLASFHKKNEKFFSNQLDAVRTEWNGRGQEYQDRLSSYFDVKIGFDATCYLTTLSIAPFNTKQKYFFSMMILNPAHQITSIAHEYMHLVFLENFSNDLISRGLDRQAILEINESLTVLIGLEFFDLFIVPDNNTKPSIQDLKEIVEKLWNEKKPFSEILEALVVART